jgi:hypothetical protein
MFRELHATVNKEGPKFKLGALTVNLGVSLWLGTKNLNQNNLNNFSAL